MGRRGVKEKIILRLEALLKSIAIRERDQAHLQLLKDKWRFIAKEQSEGSVGGNYQEGPPRVEGFLQKQAKDIHTKVWDEELDQISREIRNKGGGFPVN